MTTAELIPVDSGPDEVPVDPPAVEASASVSKQSGTEEAVAPAAPEAEIPGWTEPLQAADTRLGLIEARLVELADLLAANGSGLDAALADVRAAQAAAVAAQADADTAQANAEMVRTAVDGALGGVETNADASATIAKRVAAVDQRQSEVDARVTAVEGLIGSLEDSFRSLNDSVAGLAERAAQHDAALADVRRSIAAEVERFTCDALVESQQSLQLAVNSIAQLSLAMAESSRDISEDVSAESATVLLDSFRVDLDAILLQLGFEALGAAAGDAFDPHLHRALKRVPTSDPQQDKTITRVIRDGYRGTATGRVLLFADVEVGRHRP